MDDREQRALINPLNNGVLKMRTTDVIPLIKFIAYNNDFSCFVIDDYPFEITSKEILMRALREQCKFPDYFGENWDAVDECLNDYSFEPSKGYLFIIKDATRLSVLLGNEFETLTNIFYDASQSWKTRNVCFKLLTFYTQ